MAARPGRRSGGKPGDAGERRFVHRGWLRAHANPLIACAYIAGALLLGAQGERLGGADVAPYVSPMSSASAIAILSAIASGMMALTAIVFSLLLVALQLGNTVYSPRILRVLGDTTSTGHALGVFTGTFVYALMAVRTIDIAGGPGINVSFVIVAFLWLLASVVVLVLLVPRSRHFTIGDVLVALHRLASEAIGRVYPGDGPAIEVRALERSRARPDLEATGELLHVGPPRYLVGLDVRRLADVGAEADAVISIPLAIGDPVSAGDRLATVHGATRPIAERHLRGAIWLGEERAAYNDPAYAIRLFVDIAIRALSPAVNDPTTAVMVLDHLDAVLRELGRRHLEDDTAFDDHGALRVVRAVPSWDDLVALALTEIHQFGRDSVQVERRLATLLRDLPEHVPPERRPAIEQFGRWRARSLVEVVHDARGWIEPTAIDPQGIGHAAAAAGVGAHGARPPK